MPRTKIGDPPSVDLERPLWTCPKCGRRFVSRNLWHACGDYSVEGFLQGKGTRARELFQRFEELIAACGPYDVAPAKTRVAFMGRVRFAGIPDRQRSRDDRGLRPSEADPSPADPQDRGNRPGLVWTLPSLASPEELDDEVLGWLRESYHQMGMQERLAKCKHEP